MNLADCNQSGQIHNFVLALEKLLLLAVNFDPEGSPKFLAKALTQRVAPKLYAKKLCHKFIRLPLPVATIQVSLMSC